MRQKKPSERVHSKETRQDKNDGNWGEEIKKREEKMSKNDCFVAWNFICFLLFL
jgi:hypothetical protein